LGDLSQGLSCHWFIYFLFFLSVSSCYIIGQDFSHESPK
jgi:hypothetical protein